jgi:16S rRNA (guanine966-N2)-methyltransferase
MRIISGAWRGRTIEAPAGTATRPTSDRAREGLFSMLASRIGSFRDLRVADLFAGTGALGLEALSRGAGHCTFVEQDRKAVTMLERNLAKLGGAERADIRAQAVEHAPAPARPVDILFMDPPYDSGLAQPTLARIAAGAWLAPGAWISVEHGPVAPNVPDGLEVDTARRFGKATILLLRKA